MKCNFYFKKLDHYFGIKLLTFDSKKIDELLQTLSENKVTFVSEKEFKQNVKEATSESIIINQDNTIAQLVKGVGCN
jgi:hypothetical protein